MIRRLIGTLVTLAALAIVVVTVLHHDRYQSMLHFGESAETELPVRDTLPAPAPATDAAAAGELTSGSAVPAESGASEGVRTDGADSAAEEPAAQIPSDSTDGQKEADRARQ